MHKKKSKVVVVGDIAVGKTTMLQVYVGQSFSKDYNMTQGG